MSFVLLVAVGAVAKFPETILPIGTDTGMYVTYARMMLNGARPYVAFYDIHPPLTYYYWELVQTVAGTDWTRTCVGGWGSLVPQPCISLLSHALDLVLSLVAAGLVYAIARRLELRPFVGLLAAVFVMWFANESMLSMEGSNPTKLTLIPSTLAVYAYLRATTRGQMGWAILAGAAGISASLAKQPGLLTLITLLVYTLPGVVRGELISRRLMLGLGIGVVAVLVPVCGYLASIGSLGGFLDEAWGYNLQRFVIGYWQSPVGLSTPTFRVDRVTAEAAGLLFVAALIGGLALWLGPTRGHQRLLLVWGLFSLVAIAGFREFDQVVPALSLLAAYGVGQLWDAAGRDGLGLGRPLAGRLGLLALLGAIFVLSSSFQLVEVRRALYERGPAGKPADPELIATYLRQDAPPGSLFVWGNAGQIYALSGRTPSTRFIIAEFTNAAGPRPALSRAQVIDDLRASPPAVIIVDPHAAEPDLTLDDYPALARVIDTCYQAVGSMPANWGVYVQKSADSECVIRAADAAKTQS
jgi:hypothetical protein